jgi:hypothetical protein
MNNPINSLVTSFVNTSADNHETTNILNQHPKTNNLNSATTQINNFGTPANFIPYHSSNNNNSTNTNNNASPFSTPPINSLYFQPYAGQNTNKSKIQPPISPNKSGHGWNSGKETIGNSN